MLLMASPQHSDVQPIEAKSWSHANFPLFLIGTLLASMHLRLKRASRPAGYNKPTFYKMYF